MRRSLPPLIATLLVLLLAVPAANAAPGDVVTLTGTLSSVHEDALGSGAESDHFALTVGSDRYQLLFGDAGPDGENGATVTVTGRLDGHTLHVATAHGSSFKIGKHAPVSMVTTGTSGTTSSGTVSPMVSGGASATASVAAVLINFTDLTSQPFTQAQVASALYGSSTSAKAFYEEESKGRMAMSGAVFGWYTINSATTGCNWSDWVTLGTNAANAAGANLSAYTNVMFIFPNTSQCGWAGLGYVPGSVTLLNGTLSVQVMTHELGHNFGLAHANAINCTVNGVRVALAAAANCTEVAYADPFSTMGNNALRHNQGSQLGELGWLADSEKVVGGPGTTYTITPYFSSSGVHLVRIPRGDGSYFDLDFRMAYGSFDNFAAGSPPVSGVTIRLGWGTASPTSSPHATQLIDTTPATSSLADAPLLAGKTLTDPVSGISFTTTSVSTLAVQVRVAESTPPSAPSGLTATPAADGTSVALAWGAASDNVAVAGYQVARNGAVVANVDANTLAWTDGSTVGSTAYTYAVTAVDTSGNAGPAATVSVTTPVNPNSAPTPTPTPPTQAPTPPTPAPADTQPPTAPQPLSVTPATTTVSLSWGASTDDVAVAGYVITRDGAQVATVTGTSWTDAGRPPRTAYTYGVSALDAAGNRSAETQASVATTADTTPPSVPRNFHRVRQSGRYVTFAWNGSGDNVRVAYYLVFRVGKSGPIARTTRTSIRLWTIRGATYYVRAVDTSGNRSGRTAGVRIRY